jgi:hypothetical protein
MKVRGSISQLKVRGNTSCGDVVNYNYLKLTFDNIANVPVTNASSVSDWNTFFNLPTSGTPFTLVTVVGNTVKLYGGSGIKIIDNLFEDNTHLLKFEDISGCITEAGEECFLGCTMTNLNLPSLVSVGFRCFADTHVTNLIFPSLQTIATQAFWDCTFTSLALPICILLGATIGNDSIFLGVATCTITLTIPAVLMTCNGGAPDGDIQYLQANNTVTIITI